MGPSAPWLFTPLRPLQPRPAIRPPSYPLYAHFDSKVPVDRSSARIPRPYSPHRSPRCISCPTSLSRDHASLPSQSAPPPHSFTTLNCVLCSSSSFQPLQSDTTHPLFFRKILFLPSVSPRSQPCNVLHTATPKRQSALPHRAKVHSVHTQASDREKETGRRFPWSLQRCYNWPTIIIR